ncbi:MAG: PEFG-CTERM sorting domain-containing protein [Thaumarchaeota archaeon]|nr:PEFG-CTERM sorting domain-containing protein [Nitrososphaerota archaeon]
MNISASLALLVVLAVVSTITISSAHAQEFENQGLPEACVGCSAEDSIAVAEEHLLRSVPISVWTDKEVYGHDEIVTLSGYVSNPSAAGTGSMPQVTVMVRNAIGSVVTIDQIDVKDDNTFEVALNTASRLWASDGVYTIKVQQGHNSNRIHIELVGGTGNPVLAMDEMMAGDGECAANELTVMDACLPYSIEGGTVTGISANTEDNSLVIMIESSGDGTLTLMPSSEVIDGVFMVLVDNEESDDYMIGEDGTITVEFGPETEVIEVIGTHVIPEFGTIAAMILAVAIVSVIVVSARSRLSIIAPRL